MRPRRLRIAGALLLAWAAGGAAAAPEGRPAAGRYVAELCVTTSAAQRSCGPAQVELGSDGSARVRVDDFVYRMKLNSSQVEVVLMHGAMQVDEFTVPYEWVGRSLQFKDDERHSQYLLQFPEPRRKP